MEKAKVSIFCTTYNHAAFIREALDGMLMQKTNFKFDILVFDDASTDGTSDIVRKYQKKYPGIIHAYISPVNTFQKAEREQILDGLYDQYLAGDYVAICEGDDAWTCENKLQTQVDFLEKNANCMMTVHAAKWIDYAKNTVTSRYLCNESRYMLPEEVILRTAGSIPTASMVMRRNAFLMRDGFPECDVGDFPMQLHAVCLGDIYYFNEEMSIYRYMHDGSWTKEYTENCEKYIHHGLGFVDFLMKYNTYTNKQFEESLWKVMVIYFYTIVENLLKINKTKAFVEAISEKNGHAYDSIAEEIIPVYDWMSGNHQPDSQIKEITAGYEHICIMGKGNYSKFIVNNLEKSGIRYDGYLLSQKAEGCEDPNVWDVSDFPYHKEATLVIVGISQIQEEAIDGTLKKHGFKNVWRPLWFHKENILG